MDSKVILAIIPVAGLLIGLFMILNADLEPGGCVNIEFAGFGSVKLCEGEGETVSDTQIVELKKNMQNYIDLQNEKFGKYIKQLENTNSNEEIIKKLKNEKEKLKQQKIDYNYLLQSDFDIINPQLEEMIEEEEAIVPILNENDLELEGTWNVVGFYKEKNTKIPYNGTITFNKDGTFTEKTFSDSEIYGSGMYDFQTVGENRLFLNNDKSNYGFYTLVKSEKESFSVRQSFGESDLTFIKNY